MSDFVLNLKKKKLKKREKMSLWRHREKSAVSPSHPTPRAKCSKRKSSWGLFLKLTPYVLDYACLSGTIVICNTSVFFLNFQLAIKISFSFIFNLVVFVPETNKAGALELKLCCCLWRLTFLLIYFLWFAFCRKTVAESDGSYRCSTRLNFCSWWQSDAGVSIQR